MRNAGQPLLGAFSGVLSRRPSLTTRGAPAAALAEGGSGPEAFAYLHSVATHPRCVNCHGRIIDGEFTPTVGDDLHPHPMNIRARITELGMACTTCHQLRNSDAEHLPPGATGAPDGAFAGVRWQMPPPGMILTTTMTPGSIMC